MRAGPIRARSLASRTCSDSGEGWAPAVELALELDRGAARDGGLGEIHQGQVGERPAAAVDRVGRAVAGVDAVAALAAEELLGAGAARDRVVAAEAGELQRVLAARERVVELRADDRLDVVEDAVVVAGPTVGGLEVHGHVHAGGGEAVADRVEADAAAPAHLRRPVG